MSTNLGKAIESLERELGLKAGFFFGLIQENDWSFVIKLHALIEAAVAHLLSKALGDGKLKDIFGRIELGDARVGKLAFIRDLELLDLKYRKVIRALSEIRNKFVHDVRNVGASLETYVSGLDRQQLNNFLEAFALGVNTEIEIAGKAVPRKKFIRENPKLGMWLAMLLLLGDVYIQKQHLELRADYTKFAEELAKSVTARATEKLKISEPM